MLIDCAGCPVRHIACDDCIVTALTTLSVGATATPMPGSTPEAAVRLDADERRVVDLFVQAGLLSREYAVTLRAERTPRLAQPGRQSRDAAEQAVAAGW